MVHNREERRETLILLCEGEEENAISLDHPCPLFPYARKPLTYSYLTCPLFWPRDTGDKVPASPEVTLAMTAAPRTLPTNPPLAEVAVHRRVASTGPRCQGRPLGEPLHHPCEP
jgi:hypothetical protein